MGGVPPPPVPDACWATAGPWNSAGEHWNGHPDFRASRPGCAARSHACAVATRARRAPGLLPRAPRPGGPGLAPTSLICQRWGNTRKPRG
eukprot:10815299-Alexandrium_andersonii.AAC.1